LRIYKKQPFVGKISSKKNAKIAFVCLSLKQKNDVKQKVFILPFVLHRLDPSICRLLKYCWFSLGQEGSCTATNPPLASYIGRWFSN